MRIVALTGGVGGPKMYAKLGLQLSALAVAGHYQDILGDFVFDQVEAELESDIRRLNVLRLVIDPLMASPAQRKCLAQEALKFGKLISGEAMRSPHSSSQHGKDET